MFKQLKSALGISSSTDSRESSGSSQSRPRRGGGASSDGSTQDINRALNSRENSAHKRARTIVDGTHRVRESDARLSPSRRDAAARPSNHEAIVKAETPDEGGPSFMDLPIWFVVDALMMDVKAQPNTELKNIREQELSMLNRTIYASFKNHNLFSVPQRLGKLPADNLTLALPRVPSTFNEANFRVQLASQEFELAELSEDAAPLTRAALESSIVNIHNVLETCGAKRNTSLRYNLSSFNLASAWRGDMNLVISNLVIPRGRNKVLNHCPSEI